MTAIHKRTLALPLLTLTLAFTMTVTAQVDRTKAPAPGPSPKVELQKAEKFKLDNGLTVIVVENHKLPKVDIQMKFDIPPVLEGELAGYQNLMGDLLGAGTSRFNKQQIDEMVDGAGARLFTGKDGTYISCLKKHFDQMLQLTYAITVSSKFPPGEFDKEKNRLASSIKARQDDPDAISSSVAQVLTYRKAHPYGELATEESVANIQRKHIYAYYQRFFRPENGYLVFVGDITPGEAKTAAERYFALWKGANELQKEMDESDNEVVENLGVMRLAKKQPQPSKERNVCFVDKPGSAQSIVKVLYPVELKPTDSRLMAGVVMNTILGGGVFNARLMQNLREDKGYTYGAYAQLTNDRLIGSWRGGASVRNEVTREAVGQIIYEMTRIRDEQVTEEELTLAKNYLAGQFGRGLEDPRTVARFELNKELNGLTDDHYATYLTRLDAVTAADVQEAAKAFINVDRATVFVVGDKDEVANSLKQFSAKQGVEYYDANGDIYRERTTPPPADITADKVLDDYLLAIGGTSKLNAVEDLKIVMSGQIGEKMVISTVMKKSPNYYSSELTVDDKLVERTKFDGNKAVQTDETGYSRDLDRDVFDIELNAVLFPEGVYREADSRLTLSGSVQIAGEKAWKLTIQTANGNVIFEYYSAETGLKLKRFERQLTQNGMIEVSTYFKDYRAVEGIKYPHLVKQSAGLNFTLTVDAIEVNQGLGDALFSVE